jgi:hypothetical protein
MKKENEKIESARKSRRGGVDSNQTHLSAADHFERAEHLLLVALRLWERRNRHLQIEEPFVWSEKAE